MAYFKIPYQKIIEKTTQNHKTSIRIAISGVQLTQTRNRSAKHYTTILETTQKLLSKSGVQYGIYVCIT